MKKLVVLLTMMVLFALTACGSGSTDTGAESGGAAGETSSEGASSEETFTIKIGHVLDENYHYQDGANHFKELVEERSDGRIIVDVHANSTLGNERDMLEGMQMGTVEMGIISSGPMAGFVPEFALLDLGYLFDSSEIAQEVLTGPIGEQLNEKMLDVGIRRLATIDAGFRNIYASKPIQTVEDLQGLKIRTLETPAHLELFQELGAAPTPMAYSELYTGLQQGVVDAAENVPEAFYSSQHFEVSKVYSETQHVYLTMMYLISEDFYNQLPADLQEIVAEAAAEAAEYHNGVIAEVKADIYQSLEESGVEIVQVDDLTPFIEGAKASWVKIAESVPNGDALLADILEATGNTLE
ncbi:TRAP transporter substrate-binding protein [Alkalihalobacillus oceani]|uniref:TRAP transporter substrate-binding protein n=1 Tax=Halalkalibacter oceani TaxID=1653776 RepID=A0A9X2IQX6_9BACI|nr:TRAP transporter substrate-binding protein [Halalkalibacter oceani]MCM3715912.1 TRAP transporter substrate-binding protein [Halalkalibacter oceani]